MREILFRGKRTDNGEWVYGAAEPYGKYGFGIKEQGLIKSGTIYVTPKVIQESVGQFTGLYDRDGNKVFEGDIIQYVDDCPEDDDMYTDRVGVVKYGKFNCGCCYGVYGFFVEGYSDILYCDGDDYSTHSCKVIGNIHDNPELIK